jgi:hypothetical protein
MVCLTRDAVNKVVSENPEKFEGHRVTTVSADEELALAIYLYESRTNG